MKEKNEIALKAKTPSERFTDMVIKEFGTTSVDVSGMDEYHRRLCQSYFMTLDTILKNNELKRDDKKNQTAFTWENVNLSQLARDIVKFTSVGLDPALPNHISLIPYKNSTSGVYDIGFIKGYKGIEIVARKYGLDVPENVICELKYSNDKFTLLKKDRNNPVETYTFEVTDAFNRGEIEGGFYYLQYADDTLNKCVVMTLADILKRKPKNASVEFWGGERDKWIKGEDGKSKKSGKETVDGWVEEMYRKTLLRAAWNGVIIDGRKIDQSYLRVTEMENLALEEPQQAPNSITLPEATSEPVKEELKDTNPTAPNF